MNELTHEELEIRESKKTGWWVFSLFVFFFVIVIAVNGVFITVALDSHTGLITENPYEKGLAYNETLERAASQEKIVSQPQYKNGVLSWQMKDDSGALIESATVKAKIIRDVQDGYDFTIELENKGNGLYEAVIEAPLPGIWSAHLSSKWDNNKHYQTVYKFITP